MNIFDALLFFNMALLCFLFGSDTSVPIIARLLLAAPIVFIVALVLHWMLHMCSMRQRLSGPLTNEQMQQTRISASTATQALIQPGSSMEINCSYGSYQ